MTGIYEVACLVVEGYEVLGTPRRRNSTLAIAAGLQFIPIPAQCSSKHDIHLSPSLETKSRKTCSKLPLSSASS